MRPISIIRDTYLYLETFERGLNLVGYIPVIGSVSGFIRQNYASIELIMGVAASIFALGLQLKNHLASGAVFTFGATLFGHGILNHMRAYLEILPTMSLFTLLPYDLVSTHFVGRRIFSYIT